MAEDDGRFAGFEGRITSVSGLRRIVREPRPAIADKVYDHIDDLARAIIERSPFVVLASASGTGVPDVSPRGDPPGFVHVLDDKTLAIPDRPGNRRLDTFNNLLVNPRLGLLFLIPGKGVTLRVTGECGIVRDRALRERLAVNGRAPELAVVVRVERVLLHCPKCVIRSKLWQPEHWPDTAGTVEAIEAAAAEDDEAELLY